MSAPPIGMIRRKPIAKAKSVIKTKGRACAVAMNQISSSTIKAPTTLLMTCRPGSRIGLELIAGRVIGIKGASHASTCGGEVARRFPDADSGAEEGKGAVVEAQA